MVSGQLDLRRKQKKSTAAGGLEHGTQASHAVAAYHLIELETYSGQSKLQARVLGSAGFRCDGCMRYLVGLDEECNMTVVDAMKDFLVDAWNKRQGC
ncbi:hypothetical protein FHG87_022835 [Trinorchestia longiramus]|nr:hypothetical protein FHG87_022835 [Trinorchestia longiramus]